MSRRPLRLLLAGLLVASVGLAVEATAFASTSSDHATAVPAKKKKKPKPVVKLGDTTLGKVLVSASDGRTLYAFVPDATDTSVSHCTDACNSIWPPLVVKKAIAGKGLDKSKLTLGVGGQVAYNGHLLYEFANDKAPGDTKGQGFVNMWHIVNPDGEPIVA